MGADLYFLFAKALGLLMKPSALFITAVAVGFVLLFTRFGPRWGRWLIGLAFFGYALVAVLPLGELALSVLENRFPARQGTSEPVTGILVLGGSFNTVMTRERAQVSLTSSAERLTEFMRLARMYPQARLIFSGGSGLVFDTKPTEAEVARTFFIEAGFDVSRVEFEDQSRNTAESARLSFAQVSPKVDERWLLITSARHMPRAMGLFRYAGWPVTAHPVDYTTLPSGASGHFWPSWPGSIGSADMAAYEWGGLLAAWLRGNIDDPFPAP